MKFDPKHIAAVLREASEDIAHWGSYADTYFQEKWKLKQDVAKYLDLATALEASDAGTA